MLDASLVAILSLGFLLGLRHALDPDHLAAIAALSSGRGGLRRSLLDGLSWGAGHAMAVGVTGGTLIVFRITVPDRLVLVGEFMVALMLIGLGAAALVSALGSRLHVHEHEHDGVVHAHLHFHAFPHRGAAPHHHPHPFRMTLRPFLVGGAHGLAGSAALALLVVTTLPTVLFGWLYLGLFGIGSIAGMGIMSLAIGLPLVLARRRALWMHRALRAVAGVVSLLIGLDLAWGIASRPEFFG